MVMYPPLLQVRGVVNGALCGRLTTLLHAGLVYPKLRGNTEYFTAMVAAAMVSAFVGGLLVGSCCIHHVPSLRAGRQLGELEKGGSSSELLSWPHRLPHHSSHILPDCHLIIQGGWNPDALVNPAVSSPADLLTTASLAASLALIEAA